MRRTVNRWLTLTLLACLGLLTASCGGYGGEAEQAVEQTGSQAGAASIDAGQSAAEPGATGAQADRADWPERIRFGLVPTEGAADIQARFRVLTDHLSDRLGVPVETQSANSYNGVITAMANDQLEFSYFGPKSYVEAARRANAEAILLELGTDGEPGYYSVFIVHRDSDIHTLEDAKGRGFAFTDPNSTSGCLVPTVLFRDKMGVAPEAYFADVRFSGSHGTSILLIGSMELDVAATNNVDFDRMVEKGAVNRDDYRVIMKSDLIPGAPIAARRDLPDSLKRAFAEAMLALSEKPEILDKLQNGGYIPTTDGQYDIIRVLERERQKLAG